MEQSIKITTVGHSTRSLEEFIQILKKYGITLLVDVRTIPRSRRNPQFNQESLPQDLLSAGIGYTHLPGLGGLRRPHADSINTAWKNASFRGYADYMQTQEFEQNLDRLIELAGQSDNVAIMCAEAVPWRCHRSLIGDALVARGVEVDDILSLSSSQPHRMTPFARVEGTQITYPQE